MDRDTHTIIVDMARGSMDAFGELYDSLSSRIFNYAKTITRNKEAAEDIIHDVLIQTLKHALQIEKVADPVAYIMVATRNHSYNVTQPGRKRIGFHYIQGCILFARLNTVSLSRFIQVTLIYLPLSISPQTI